MRYVNLSSVLALRLISVSVKKRFPDYKSLIDAKLLLECEVRKNITLAITQLFEKIEVNLVSYHIVQIC